jgi:hypothetical protein
MIENRVTILEREIEDLERRLSSLEAFVKRLPLYHPSGIPFKDPYLDGVSDYWRPEDA